MLCNSGRTRITPCRRISSQTPAHGPPTIYIRCQDFPVSCAGPAVHLSRSELINQRLDHICSSIVGGRGSGVDRLCTHRPGYQVKYDVCMHAHHARPTLPGPSTIASRPNTYDLTQSSFCGLDEQRNWVYDWVCLPWLQITSGVLSLRSVRIAWPTWKYNSKHWDWDFSFTYCRRDAVSGSRSTQQARPASCVWPEG